MQAIQPEAARIFNKAMMAIEIQYQHRAATKKTDQLNISSISCIFNFVLKR
jgi:hypothetical protein